MSERPSWFPDTKGFIAIAVVCSFVSVVFVCMFFPPTGLDQASLTIVSILVTALTVKFGTVVDYNYGSSQGSKDRAEVQDKVMTQLALGAATTAAVTEAAQVAAPPAAAQAAPLAVDAELDARGIKPLLRKTKRS
jgi:hypothetical protein